MKECTLNESHEYILNMLKFVDEICKENKITYFLSGGSAIGAMRHHGFIPWDDDADIMMPRKDFMKFIEITKNMSGKYKTGSLYGDYNWTFPFARIWDTTTQIEYENLNEAATGIFIDIYPMDGLPNSSILTRLHYLHNKICYVMLNASMRKKFKANEKYIPIKKLLALICKKIGSKKICAHIDRSAAKLSFDRSEYVGCTVLAHYMERECFPRKDFVSMVYVPFEKTNMPIPNGCEDYLTRLYGDFMTPPPVEIAESEHHMKAYIK